MEVITTLKTHSRTFKIVLHDGYYCAVEDKYIDADGKLNTVLYGPALHTGTTAEECIRNTEMACSVDDLVEQGVDPIVASVMVVGRVDYYTATKMVSYAQAAQ